MKKAKRQSNIELLRIFAMVMIVLFHVQFDGPQALLTGDNGYFAQPIIFLRLLIFEIGAPFGMIGNGLFIIISGYFMNANEHINTGKIAKKLLLQMGFAALTLMLAYAVWINFFNDGTVYWKTITKNVFNDDWWFIGYYFTIIIIAKVFLNGFTAKLTQNQFRALLLTVLGVSQFEWSRHLLESLATQLRVLVIGIFFFLLGGYIARYNPFKKLKTGSVILAIATGYGIRFLSAYNMVSESIDYFIKSKSAGRFVQSVQSFSNYEITVVILVTFIFELFRRWNVPNNAVINFVGKSTLMIYFLHGNDFYQNYYIHDSWMETLRASLVMYCLKWLKWAVIAFAIGVAGYAVYTLLEKMIPRLRPIFFVQDSNDCEVPRAN